MAGNDETTAPNPRRRSRRWLVAAAKGAFVAVWGFGWLVSAALVGAGLLAQHYGAGELAAVLFTTAIGVFVVWLVSMGAFP